MKDLFCSDHVLSTKKFEIRHYFRVVKNSTLFTCHALLTQLGRDVTTGKIQVPPLRWWAKSAPNGWNRVKVSENLGATAVAPVALVDTSLLGSMSNLRRNILL